MFHGGKQGTSQVRGDSAALPRPTPERNACRKGPGVGGARSSPTARLEAARPHEGTRHTCPSPVTRRQAQGWLCGWLCRGSQAWDSPGPHWTPHGREASPASPAPRRGRGGPTTAYAETVAWPSAPGPTALDPVRPGDVSLIGAGSPLATCLCDPPAPTVLLPAPPVASGTCVPW